MNNMVKPLISPALVNNIREKLEKVDHTAWSSIEYEVQDNAQCLFISVHLRQSTSLQARKQLLKLIYDIVDPLIPHRYGDFPWMAVLLENNEVIDSVFHGTY